jgi:hypothetical protein
MVDSVVMLDLEANGAADLLQPTIMASPGQPVEELRGRIRHLIPPTSSTTAHRPT